MPAWTFQKGLEAAPLPVEAGGNVLEELGAGIGGAQGGALAFKVGALVLAGDSSVERGRFPGRSWGGSVDEPLPDDLVYDSRLVLERRTNRFYLCVC